MTTKAMSYHLSKCTGCGWCEGGGEDEEQADRPSISKLAHLVYQGVRASNGITTNLKGESPLPEGFMVGGVAEEQIAPYTTFQFHSSDAEAWIQDFITTHYETLRTRPEMYMGAWLNTDTGWVHLDVAQRYSDEYTAYTVAERRGEVAIWSLEHQEEIRI